MENKTSKKKRKSIKENIKIEKTQKEKSEKKEKPKKDKVEKEDKKESDKKESDKKESDKKEKDKIKKEKKRKSIAKENQKKEMTKLEKEFQKMEIKEKKKIAKEIKDKYKEIQFYLPNPFKIDSAEIKKLSKLDKDKCLICQQSFKVNSEVLYMPCLHLYHKTCIVRWLIHNDKCPTCKASYKNEDKKKEKTNNYIDEGSEENDSDNDDDNYFGTTEEEDAILNLLGIDSLEAYLKGEQDFDSDEDIFF